MPRPYCLVHQGSGNFGHARKQPAAGSCLCEEHHPVRSQGQAGERHVSLEVQIAAFGDCCRANGLDPVMNFTDIASGRKDDRAEYRRMLAHAVEHGVGNVVVLFLYCFGRNPWEYSGAIGNCRSGA